MTVRVGAQKSGMTAEDHRLAMQTLVAHSAALQARAGVVSGLTLTKVSGMQNKITPGQAWVDGTSATNQGAYPVTVDADELFTHADGDATRDRIDLVILEVLDDPYDASGSQLGRVRVVQGAYPSSGEPVVSAVPANSIALWEQRVNALTSAGGGGLNVALVTSRRQIVVAQGGIVPVANQAERDALGIYGGLYVHRMDTGVLERHNGTAWVPVVNAGSVEFFLATSDAATNTTYAAGSPSGTFVAPASGKVMMHLTALLSGDEHALQSFRVYLGTSSAGTLVMDSTDSRAISNRGTDSVRIGAGFLVTGLTPGATYFVTGAHRVTGATGTFGERRISVIPAP